jgi:alpha-amylase/alpha-mannosidase (GH57 family)
MADPPLKVAFFWHMHQPYYKSPRTGVYRLPWVRLHTVKDYADMVMRLEAFPGVKANFNLVPCLVEQIMDYASGGVKERHLDLSRKPAADLTHEDKVALIQQFFLGNRKTMIEPYPRYRSLLEKCIDLDSEYKVHAALRKFSRQDYLDLQVWSNLAWIGPTLAGDPLIRDLRARERRFTETMKQRLLERHMEIMRAVLEKYKQLAGQGQIEISVSPYFHPVLPLLCDSESVRVALPDTDLPGNRIQFAEDARVQIASGIDLHKQVFGTEPAGLWPPEGAVSDAAAGLAHRCGIKWIAADEKILEASLGIRLRDPVTGRIGRPDLLYKPHRLECDGGEVAVFFRDRILSDLIGFEYWERPAREAVSDFMGKLETTRKALGAECAQSVVLIALDGENCWEFYDRGGDAFLRRLYSELSASKTIETIRLSEALETIKPLPGLKSLYPGSWIGNNLGTWIGHSEDNMAWDMIHEARAQLKSREETLDETQHQSAWQSIYATEGSDWFWWYGEEHASREDPEFDALFRAHIRHVYETLGIHVPHRVLEPIMARKRGIATPLEPVAVIKPVLDGRVTTFYEWKLAGLYESYRDGAKGLARSRVLDSIYFGFDHDSLYLRFDTSISPQAPDFADYTFQLEFEDPTHMVMSLRAPEARSPGQTALMVEPDSVAGEIEAAALEVVEIRVPFAQIQASPGALVSLRIAVLEAGGVIERRPIHDMLSLSVPKPDFEAEHWSTL